MILLLIAPDEAEKEYRFEANSGITVGRSSNCDIVLLFSFISWIHCTFVLIAEDEEIFYYLLFDGAILGKPSQNGTWVNGVQIDRGHRVQAKDKITFAENLDYPQLIALFDDEPDGGTHAEE